MKTCETNRIACTTEDLDHFHSLAMFLGFDKLLQGNLFSKDIDLAMFHTMRSPSVSNVLDILPK
jgi:hypothetical protein